MDCPRCTNVNLVVSDRAGIEIDYCPTCRGIWLDRGELDKIIERSQSYAAMAPTAVNHPPSREDYRYEEHGHDKHRDHDSHGYSGHDSYKHGRRKSWLQELFD